MKEATPRPWLPDPDVPDAIQNFQGHEVVYSVHSEANRALIVRAVNAHDDLVEAASNALAQMVMDGYEHEPGALGYSVVVELRAAIALAKGGAAP